MKILWYSAFWQQIPFSAANSRLCDGRNHGALSMSVLRVNCLICEEASTGHNVLLSPGILSLLFLLAVVQSSSFTFCKGSLTVQLPGTPVFMLQLSQQLFKTLSLSDSLLFSFFSFFSLPTLHFCCSPCKTAQTALPSHSPSIFISPLCQMAGLQRFASFSNFLLSLCKWPLTVAQMGAAVRSDGSTRCFPPHANKHERILIQPWFLKKKKKKKLPNPASKLNVNTYISGKLLEIGFLPWWWISVSQELEMVQVFNLLRLQTWTSFSLFGLKNKCATTNWW